MIDGKATGMFADPRLDPAAPRGQAGDLTWSGRLTRFQPQAGSPAVDAGIDLKARFNLDHGGFDFLKSKTPAGNAPDIGASPAGNAPDIGAIEQRKRDVEQ